MRREKSRKGISWIRLILMLGALIVLGLMMYYLQKTASMNEDAKAVPEHESSQALRSNESEKLVQGREPVLRTEGMVQADQNLAIKNAENKRNVRSRNTNVRTEADTRRTEEQVLNRVKEADEKTLMKQKEAEARRLESEGGERPQSLIDTDQKTRTKREDKSAATKKELPRGEAAKNLLVVLEMLEKKNQTLVTKHKAPRTFLLGLSEQTNDLISKVNKASDDAVCGALKADVIKLQEAVMSNREQVQFYEKELKKLSNVLTIYCG